MVSQGMERLAQLMHTPPASIKTSEEYSSESEMESAHVADSSTSGEEAKRGRRRTTKRQSRRNSPSPSSSTSRYPSPPARMRSSRSSMSSKKKKARRKRGRKRTQRGESIALSMEVMGTPTRPPKVSPILSATTIRSIRYGGRSGCATNWG